MWIFTPGHSPGHLSYSLAEHGVLFDGDVLFRGSVGRTDLPGASWEVLLESIAKPCSTRSRRRRSSIRATWVRRRSAQSARSNPFLAELAR